MVVRKRGIVLLAVLFLLVLLLVTSLAFLTYQSNSYQTASLLSQSEAARLIALSGIEDARVKFSQDIQFPPMSNQEQNLFSYTEHILDANDQEYGVFTVSIDLERSGPPYYLARFHSVGFLGSREDPTASRELIVDIDICPFDRANPSSPNPNLYNVLWYRDTGS